MQRRYVMAIDGGGVPVRCVVADFQGAILGCGSAEAPPESGSAWDATLAALRAAVATTLAGLESEVPAIDAAVAGISGVGFEGSHVEEVEALLAEIVPQAGRVRVLPDLAIAFWGALSMPVGVVVCGGTGSASYGRNVIGDTCHVGGWGPLLGDEGSAYDIGRRALRAVARAEDGRGRTTALSLMVARHFDVHDPLELAQAFSLDPPSREAVAGLLSVVSQAARRNDPVAMQIFATAARDLAISVATVLRRLRLLDQRTSVSFSGDVFEAGRSLLDPFAQAIHDASPLARVEPPLLPPIGGAFRLALQAIGVTMDEPIVHRFARGLVRNGW